MKLFNIWSCSMLFVAIAIFTHSCNSDVKPTNDRNADSARVKQDKASLDETIKKLDVPSQVFSAPGDQLSLIRGKKGTVIFLTPNDLETVDGQAPGDKIVVELKELTNAAELARANAATVSNSRLLISGGAYYINITSGGKQLKVRNGKSLKVAFPKITDSAMTLFYGARDSAGQMNWQPTDEPLTSKNGYSVDTRDTGADKSIMVYNSRSFRLMGYVGNEKSFKRDTATLSSLKKSARDAAEQQAYKSKIQDSVSTDKLKEIIKTTKKLNESLYDISGIKQLGWINCDRFAAAEKTNITYTIDPKDSISYAQVYVIYRQNNSAMVFSFYNSKTTGTRELEGLPVGYQARILAVTNKNGALLTSKIDITIVRNQHSMFKWKKTTTEELNSFFDPNNGWGQ